MITITEIKENLGSIIWLTIKVLAINIVLIYLLQLTLGFNTLWFIVPLFIVELACAIYYLRTPLFIDYEEAALEMLENTENMQAEVEIHKANFELVKADYIKSKAKYETLKADYTKSKADYESIKTELKQIDLLQNQITSLEKQKAEQKKQFESWAEQLRAEREQMEISVKAIKFIESEFKEGKEIAKLLKNANIQDLDIALKKLRAAINPKLNTFILNQ